MSLTSLVQVYLQHETIPARNRHLVLQLALVFMCGVQQLSPGAYFLRKDLYPSLIQFMDSPSTEQFTFEASLLLVILANFHRSDASKLNPYLKRLEETGQHILHKICWATNHALATTIKAYQEIHDESPPSTFKSTVGSVFESLRPDRALATKHIDPPKELFKDQPIEACVSLFPIYELLCANAHFPSVLLESLSRNNNLLFTSFSLSSYLLTHASSTSSPRSLAYANLCLNWLLILSQNVQVLEALSRPNSVAIRLCRQRLPFLPPPLPKRLPICALLDCCILWLRHNLHRRLEVHSYINCIWTCQQVVYFLAESHTRLEYEWREFWSAILGLLRFLAAKLDSLYTTGGVEKLVHETILLLDLCLTESSAFLPSPQALHQFIYDLVHDCHVLQNQISLLQTLAMPVSSKQTLWSEDPLRITTSIVEITRFYESKIAASGARSAVQAMQIVAREIDQDGLHGLRESRRGALPKHSNEVFGFARFACVDSLALMP
ncbi:hypothetical protein GYMLUDRAFT_65921 [Collybiopsis luxurians FD-317 M1]|nr:hypothetical protein GYMLUDRAFT_65921 [Collybiopsis luxurians FD-317 M1]